LVAPYATKGKYRRGLSIWTNERVVVAIGNRIFTTATLTIIKRCPEGMNSQINLEVELETKFK